MSGLNPKTSKPLMKNNLYEFPSCRDFFLLDYEENIKNFKTTNLKDPEYIYVTAENKEKKIHEKILKRIDFLKDYEIIKVLTLKKNEINFIIPKEIFNNAREIRILTEIKKRIPLMKEIHRKTKINLDTKDNIIFKEHFSVPTSQKFYNRVFNLIIQKLGSNKHPNAQNQNNNNSFTNINNIIINNDPTNIINNNITNNNNFNNFVPNNSNITKNINNLKNIDNNFEQQPQNGNGGNNSNTQMFFNNIINRNNNLSINSFVQYNNINNNNNNNGPRNYNNISNGNNVSINNPIYQNSNNSQNQNFKTNNNINPHQMNQNFLNTHEDIEMKDDTGNGTTTPSSPQFTSQQGQNTSQSNNSQPGQNYNNSQLNQNFSQPYNPQPGQNPSQTYNHQPNQNFSQPYNPQPGQNPSQTYNPQPGQNPSQTYNPQPGQNPSQTYNPQPGQNPSQPFNPQPGQNPSQPFNPQPGQNPPQPYNPQPGQNPPQPYNPQPGQNPPQPFNPQSGQNPPPSPPPQPPSQPNYIFPKKGLRNIGSTCYMNATLQCLLHVTELIAYFIDEYPRDLNTLMKINSNVQSGGDISRAFYNLINGVYDKPEYLSNSKKNLNLQTNEKKSGWNIFGSWGINKNNNSFSPEEFKRSLGLHNPQFRKFEANDSKDLILYLLQTMHEELNYFGNINKRLKYIPNQYNMYETYNHFISNYNTNNFSKISLLFYGTYINTTICKVCKQMLFNFQKFEFISFGMFYYNKQKFNIMDGFRDNSKPCQLTGDNICNICKKMQEVETTCKIFEPPQKLLIHLDYGNNKKYQPSSIEFDEEIDITKYVAFDYKQQFKYRIIGVCTHYGYSGSYGHFVAFCRHREKNIWYEFNDSFVSECSKNNIYRGSPYLLLYERIF